MSLTDMARAARAATPDRITRELTPVYPTITNGESWLVSLNLGRHGEPSAICMLCLTKKSQGDRKQRWYDCARLERYREGTAYDEIVEDVRDWFQDARFARQTLLVDQTGVGRAVVDLFREARVQAKILPVTVTGQGDVVRDGTGGWCFPKRELVSVMTRVLGGKRFGSSERLFCANQDDPLFPTLLKELETFSSKVDLRGGTAETWRENANYDILLGVSIAVLAGERLNQRFSVA